jgi:hypothetical protein
LPRQALKKIAKCRKEPEIVAKPGLGIGIDAGIKIGFTLGERLEDARQRVHASRGDGPSYNRTKWAGRGGEGSRQRENARADHRSDHHGGQREE